MAFARLVGGEPAIEHIAPRKYGTIFPSADDMPSSPGRSRLALVAGRHCWPVARVDTAWRRRDFLSRGVLAVTYGYGAEQRRGRHRYSRYLHVETPRCEVHMGINGSPRARVPDLAQNSRADSGAQDQR